MARPRVAAVALTAFLSGTIAHAQPDAARSQARDLGEAGFTALDNQEWAKAEDLFRSADALYHAPTLLLGLARAEAHLGKVVEAWEDYHRILVEGPPPGATPPMVQAVKDAGVEITAVANRRAALTIRVTGATHAMVTLDGVPLSEASLASATPVNPGKHTVRATADGAVPAESHVSVQEGDAVDVPLALEPRGAPAQLSWSSSNSGLGAQRTLALAALGVGTVSLATGAVAGLLAVGKHGDLTSSPCASAGCNASDLSSYAVERDAYHTLGTVSTIAFILGGAAAASGTVLLLTTPHESKGVAVMPFATAGGGGVVGSF